MKSGTIATLAGAALMVAVTAATALATAADNPIAARRSLMKGTGGAAKAIGAMLDGSVPFDAAKAAEATRIIAAAGQGFSSNFVRLFPENSRTGDTKAAAEIWGNAADFKSKARALETNAKAAIAAAAMGADSFKAAAGKVFSCKGCHQKYKLN
jgi:cytochrome c556